jgi:glucose/arabinose dehydrogenase
MTPKYAHLLPALGLLAACSSGPSKEEKQQAQTDNPAQTITTPKEESVHLPAPYASKSVTHRVDVIDWPAGQTPTAPAGFTVAEFAGGLQSPRWAYVAPNGDVFVSEAATLPKGLKKDCASTSRARCSPPAPTVSRFFAIPTATASPMCVRYS